jgi:N-acetyl-anhydromuramyl-L-alanine amidase AmpD
MSFNFKFSDPKRPVNTIVLHCSATKVTADYSVEQLTADHKARGFDGPGYHFYIRKTGEVVPLRAVTRIGAHVQGHNTGSIGICYEGGLDTSGKAADTRTDEQKEAMHKLVLALVAFLKTVGQKVTTICGHRDFSPDTNHNGKIDPWERIKECPCFDAIPEFAYAKAA